MRIHRYSIVSAILILLANVRSVHAELILPFRLPEDSGLAKEIVHGRLDANGKLTVTKVLKGKLDTKEPIPIHSGKELYQSLQTICPQPGTIEVVLYLKENQEEGWQLIDLSRGAVFFQNEDVYLVHAEGNREGNSRPSKHPSVKRSKFLEDAQKMANAQSLRDKLLSQKPSPERIRNLVSFLHGQPEEYFFYHLHSIKRKIPALAKEEEQALVELFTKANFPVRVELLLNTLILTPQSQKAFDTACIFLDHQHRRDIRQAAMNAITAIDRYQAQIQLLDYLNLAEPEAIKILYVLCPDSRFQYNPRFIEPILVYAKAVRQIHASGNRQILGNESYALIMLLSEIGHPKMILLLSDWVIAQDHVTSNQATSTLQNLLGLNWGDKPEEAAKVWLEKAKPFLEADYDLKTPKGLQKWFDAYKKADSGTRKILVRLWAFEAKIDEKALLEAASQKETQEAVQEILKTLWAHQRLSGESRKTIVEKFVRVELIEIPSPNESLGSRELQIVAHRTFPFPNEAWVENRSSIVIGNEKPKLEGGFGAFSLNGTGKLVVGSMGGGSYPGSPKAQAILHLREIKRGDGNPRVLWEKEWILGSIQLKKIEK